MTARAGHIEISHAMDTSFFLNAFLCFCCRRRNLSDIYSDNGGNVVGAERE